ncbi:MAG: hypothetical protein JNL11_05135 [Bdellovibrionaceae bacterium]|nr:hypothetical protein [Pseudobdellovibrionaceae bacterium]
MPRLAPLLGLLFLFLTSLALAQKGGKGGKGGLSGSGGGGGVICFTSANDAKAADVYLNDHITLPEAILDKGRLQVLESWEMDQQKHAIWTARPGDTWETHLENVKNALRDRLPLFMYRLDQTSDWIKQASWEKVDHLQLLEDAKPIYSIPDTCRRVQLVVRYSEGNNARGDGPVDEAPKLKIIFVKEYFDRLSITDRAMLMLHEQLYVLGQSTGQLTSDITRAFIRIFFSNDISGTPPREMFLYRSPTEQFVRTSLIQYFGDYIVYFNKSEFLSKGEPFTPQRHFYMYLQQTLRIRIKMSACLAEAKTKGTADSHCLFDVMGEYQKTESVPNEEAFIFMATYYFEQHRSLNSDQVVDPTGRNPDLFRMSMNIMCSSLEAGKDSPHLFVRKAWKYCQEWAAFRLASFNHPRK